MGLIKLFILIKNISFSKNINQFFKNYFFIFKNPFIYRLFSYSIFQKKVKFIYKKNFLINLKKKKSSSLVCKSKLYIVKYILF